MTDISKHPLLVRRREELDKEEKNYLRAKDFLSGDTVELLHRLCDLINSFKCDDPPHKAVFILGRCGPIIEDIMSARRVVASYEAREASYEKLCRTLVPNDDPGGFQEPE